MTRTDTGQQLPQSGGRLAVPGHLALRLVEHCASPRFDYERLLELSALHPPLLRSWLDWFGLPAAPNGLIDRLNKLGRSTCRHLVLVFVGDLGVRSFDATEHAAWLSLLQASERAKQAARALGENPQRVAWLTLLATTEPLDAPDPVLADVMRFRMADDADLVDTHAALRIVATVLRENDAELTRSAQVLLGGASVAELTIPGALASMALPDDWRAGGDEAIARAWPDISRALRTLDGWVWPTATAQREQILSDAVHLVDRLIGQSAFALRWERDGMGIERLAGMGELSQFTVAVDSGRSLISDSFRSDRLRELLDSQEAAVVDRQLLLRLGVGMAWAVPIGAPNQHGAVLLVGRGPGARHDFEGVVLAWLRAVAGEALARMDAIDLLVTRGQEEREQYLRETVHEVNNPLSVVQNYLHVLAMRMESDGGISDQLSLINQEVGRAAEILRRFVVAVRDESEALPIESGAGGTTESIEAIADAVVRLMGPTAQTNNVELKLAGTLPDQITAADAGRLRQLLTNLIANAVDACAGGGAVSLGLRSGLYRAGLPSHAITVIDDGPGIPTRHLARLVQAKPTSKAGDHQGLGLSVAFRLATELTGSLDCETGPTGTCFTLYLPARAPASDRPNETMVVAGAPPPADGAPTFSPALTQ